jgi:tape measure domain-containing protein
MAVFDDGDIVLDLRLDDKNFSVTVKNSGRLLSELRGNLQKAADGANDTQRHFNSLSTSFRHTVMSLAAVRFAMMDVHDVFLRLPMSILRTSGEIERMTKLMEGLSKASTDAARAQEAADNTKFILDKAKNAPFEIEALSNAFVKFKSGGLDPTNGSLQALIDSVARFGGDSQSLARASVAIQQMAGKGVISMEELRQQLGEAVPDAMRLMAEGMGISMAELTKRVSLGTVESTDALRRMFTMMEFHNRGAALKMMDTWTGLTARLKTEWTILQTEIGKSGFADAVKDQLKDLIDAMSSPEGIAMARQFGKELAELVKNLRIFADALRENWALIKVVGEALLIAFGVNKMRTIMGGFRDALREQNNLIRVAHEKQVMQAQMRAAELAADARVAAEKVAKDKAEVVSARAKYTQLKAEHSKHLAEIRALDAANAISRARLAAGGTFEAQIIAQRKEKIKQIRAEDRETKKLMKTEKDLQSTVSGGIFAAQQAAWAKENMARAATQAAEKMAKVSTAGIAMRAMLGTLGGPIGLVTAALSIGIPAWLEWGNAGEKAIQKIRDALNTNTANQETIDLISNQIIQKQKELNEFNNRTRGFSLLPKTMGDVQEEMAERKRLEGEIAQLERDMQTARTQRQQNAAEASIAAQKRTFQRELAESDAHFRSLAIKVQDDTAAKLEGVKKGSEEEIRINKEKSLAIHKIVQDSSNAQLDILERHRKQASDLLKEAKKGGNQDQVKGAQALLDDLTEKTIAKDLERFSKDAMHLSDPNNFKIEKTKKPDPLQQALEKSRGDLESAKIKMDDLLDGAVTFSRLKEAAFNELMGDRKAGMFNVKDDRGNSVAPSAKDKRFDEYSFNKAGVEQLNRERQVQKALISLTAQSAQERENALERYSNSEYYDQESTGVRRLERQLAKLKETLVEGTPAFKNFEENTRNIISDQAVADLLNFTATFKRTRDEIDVGLQTTDIGRKKAAYELETRILKSQLEQRRKEIEKNADMSSDAVINSLAKATEEYNLLLDKLAREQARKLMTPLQQLSEQWNDVTDRMRQASVRWTNDTMDNIVAMVKGGKFEWRTLVDSILTDIARISLQKSIGGLMNNAFDKGINMIAGMFGADTSMGSNRIPIDPVTGAVPTVDVGASGKATEAIKQSEIFNTANERLSSMWDSVKTGMDNVWTGLKGMLGSLGDGLSNLVSGLGSALSSFLSSLSGGGGGGILGDIIGIVGSMAGAFAGGMGGGMVSATGSVATASYTGYGGMGSPTMRFANGGIMTPFGAVALRKYAKGGIANFPQLALYGEGKMPEAYVPLPDGRTIPVTLSGGSSGDPTVIMNIVVNNDGTESANTSGSDDSAMWRRFATRVTTVVREELVVQKRPGGILAR